MENSKLIMHFTAIYRSAVAHYRACLWPTFQVVNECIYDPWAMIGDFNALISSEERIGGSSRSTGVCSFFVD